MLKRLSLVLLFILVLSFTVQPVSAQESGPVYIVKSGDTLYDIALRFNVSVDDLIAANPSINPNFLAEGQQIIIPGLEGVTGVLETQVIALGDTLRGISRRTQVPADMLTKLNHLVSPTELYVGKSLIVPTQGGQEPLKARTSASPGETLLELAVKQGSDPWTLAALNGLSGTWDTLPGDILYSPTGSSEADATGLPSAFLSASLEPLPLVQGNTEVIRVRVPEGVSVSGTLVDKPLHFFPENGEQIALQGIHAMLDPGVYPLSIEVTLPDGSRQSFEQMTLVASGNYPQEPLVVSPELIDPIVTKPEDELVAKIVEPATPDKLWQGAFNLPVYVPDGEKPCIFDWFGTRRSYNGGAYDYFHSGIDYGVCFAAHPFDIYAAAAGTVVFAAPLSVRGNATFIDHGHGVYTGYFHQQEIYVAVGQQVQAGELIGKIGGTGRVTGPHLHWDLWVNGVQVNPLDWLKQAYP